MSCLELLIYVNILFQALWGSIDYVFRLFHESLHYFSQNAIYSPALGLLHLRHHGTSSKQQQQRLSGTF